MNILFDIGHPAHVHLFRNAIHTLVGHGHRIVVSIREKPLIRQLLRHYGIEPVRASTARSSLLGLGWELLEHDYHVLRLGRRYAFDIMAGTSVAVAHAARLVGARSLVFSEDDANVVSLFARITYPLAHKVIVPSIITDQRRANYVCHTSYHELAYLHPNHYSPDRSVLDELGVTPGEPYFIVRLVSFKAHHDVGEKGIAKEIQFRLIALLAKHGKVFVTAEGELTEDLKPYQIAIPPHRMHDALAFARLVVSDSQTMTAEAAVLGTPAIRCNSFVGRLAYLEELQRYGLTYGYTPAAAEEMLTGIQDLLTTESLAERWQERRQRMLAEKVDFHAWIVDFLESID